MSKGTRSVSGNSFVTFYPYMRTSKGSVELSHLITALNIRDTSALLIGVTLRYSIGKANK